MKTLLLSLLLCLNAKAATFSDFLRALALVEDAQGRPTDHGLGLGPLCIHRAYFLDAMKFDRNIGVHGYEMCQHPRGAAVVAEGYLRWHAPEAWARRDWFTLAQIHHAGPGGAKRGRGKAFAQRVVNLMKQ
jgi:hypothetical protein